MAPALPGSAGALRRARVPRHCADRARGAIGRRSPLMASGATMSGAAGRPPGPPGSGYEFTLPNAPPPLPLLATALPPESRAARLSRSLRRAAPASLGCAVAAGGLAFVGRERRAERRKAHLEAYARRVASHAEATSSHRSRSDSRRTDPSDAGKRHLPARRKAGKQQAPPKQQQQPPPAPPQPQPAPQPPRALSETLVDLISGAVAEATQLALLYPLDTLKVRCQLSRRRPGAELKALMAGGAGMRALYAGVAPAALGASLFGGAYMLAYQAFYRRNVRLLGRGGVDEEALALPALAAAAGGAAVLANCCTALLEVPLDTARQRLQAGVAAGPLTRVIAASAKAGPRVLYAGFVPFLLRTIPLDALQFFVYAGLQSARERADAAAADQPAAATQPSAVQVWLADAGLDMILGGVAGGVSAFATMPLDCIKTHINCQTGAGPTGVIPVTRAIWAASGPRGFFAGTTSRLAERVPSCAVYWLAAEATRRVLSPEERAAGAEAVPA